MDTKNLKKLVKNAYEREKLQESLIILAWTIPLSLVSLWVCGTPKLSIFLGVILSITTVLFLWRGQILAKAALQGLTLGTFAFAAPLSLHVTGLCCKADLEKEICVMTGLIVGIILGKFLSSTHGRKLAFILSSLLVVLLTGVLGCAPMGAGAVIGLVLGVIIPILPSYVFFKNRIA